MNILVIFLGYFYALIGTIFLFVPLIYLELGRPKDLIKAFLNLLIGFVLIIKNKTISESLTVIILLLTVVIVLYVLELFFARWNQLIDKEKNKLTTLSEFKNNISKILESINLGFKNFAKPLNFFNFDSNKTKVTSKKWVRNDKNDSIDV